MFTAFQAVNRLVMNLVQLVLINACRWSVCTPRYEIFDTTGRLMYTIEGICCYIKCCADVPFKVTCCLSLVGVTIRWNIVYKEKELIIPLYKTIVMPHLEYCIQAWRPYRKKDIDMLERVQRRATKIITKLRNISYEMCLKECGLTTLETKIDIYLIRAGYTWIDGLDSRYAKRLPCLAAIWGWFSGWQSC